MKHFLLSVFCISLSLLSFSQKNDTINIFPHAEKKKKKKDAVQEIQANPIAEKGVIRNIKYGTSAGSCTGYCSQEAAIDSANIIKTTKSLPEDKAKPAKTESNETTSTQWDVLKSTVQVNSFFEIPAKVGTPGANGGVFEWIEINYSGKIHKVTFDATGHEEYEGLKNLSKQLKQITGF